MLNLPEYARGFEGRDCRTSPTLWSKLSLDGLSPAFGSISCSGKKQNKETETSFSLIRFRDEKWRQQMTQKRKKSETGCSMFGYFQLSIW